MVARSCNCPANVPEIIDLAKLVKTIQNAGVVSLKFSSLAPSATP